MDLDWVATFLDAADTESFREVARRRFMSQAAVSQQIARLEQALGHPLFHRHGRRVALTEAGAQFRVYAARMVALWQEAAAPTPAARELTATVGAVPVLGDTVLPWLVRRWLARIPRLDLCVRVGSLADLVSWGVDGALVREPPSVPGWSAQPLWSEPVALYVGPDGHDWDGAAPDFEQLLGDRPLLLDAGAPYNDALLARLAQSGYRPRTMLVDQGGVVKRLVAEGLGVTILPTGSVFREVVEGRLVEVPGPDLSLMRDTVWWMTPDERPRTFALQVAEQLLGERHRGGAGGRGELAEPGRGHAVPPAPRSAADLD